jgi:hypothetical protein
MSGSAISVIGNSADINQKSFRSAFNPIPWEKLSLWRRQSLIGIRLNAQGVANV